MPILFAGGEGESLTITGSPTWTTSGSLHDVNMSRGAMWLDNADTLKATFTATSDLWVHWMSYISPANSNSGTMATFNSGTTPVVRLHAYSDANDFVVFEYFNGSTWVEIALDPGFPSATRMTLDLHILLSSSGSFTLFQDETEIEVFEGDTTLAASTIDNVVFSGVTGSISNAVSQILVRTTSTLGMQVETLGATADGTDTAFTNDYTAIDEIGLSVDADAVFGVSNGDIQTFVMENVSVPVNTTIAAVVLGARASRGSTGPQNLQLVTQSNSINYPSSNLPGFDLSLRPYQVVLANDPDTGTSWSASGVDAMQSGLKAIT